MRGIMYLTILMSLFSLVLLGCSSNDKTNNQRQVINGEEAEVGQGAIPERSECSGYPFGIEICGLIKAGKIVHCVLKKDQDEFEIWLRAGNPEIPDSVIQMKERSPADKGAAYQIIHLDKESMKSFGYTWAEGASVGIKTESILSARDSAGASLKQYEQVAEVDIKCEEAKVGADFLEPPSSINFMSVQELSRNPALAQQIMG